MIAVCSPSISTNAAFKSKQPVFFKGKVFMWILEEQVLSIPSNTTFQEIRIHGFFAATCFLTCIWNKLRENETFHYWVYGEQSWHNSRFMHIQCDQDWMYNFSSQSIQMLFKCIISNPNHTTMVYCCPWSCTNTANYYLKQIFEIFSPVPNVILLWTAFRYQIQLQGSCSSTAWVPLAPRLSFSNQFINYWPWHRSYV